MAKTTFRNTMAVMAILAISACAEGSAVVTGKQRPAINPDQVQLYVDPPKTPYEVIALVNATSGNGLTDQQSINYAVDELKKQAAAVGANGVIMGQPRSQFGGIMMSGTIPIPYDEQSVSGTAIYIPR